MISQFGVMGPVLFGALLVGLWHLRRNVQLAAFALPALVVVSVQALLAGQGLCQLGGFGVFLQGTVLAMTVLAARPRLRLAGLAINVALALALPLLTVFPETRLGGGRPFLFRYLGRADLSQQVIALAQQAGNLPGGLGRSRCAGRPVLYRARQRVALLRPRPQGKPQSHYEQSYPLPVAMTEQVLVVTGRPLPCFGTPLPLKAEGGAFARRNLAAYVTDATCAGQLDPVALTSGVAGRISPSLPWQGILWRGEQNA